MGSNDVLIVQRCGMPCNTAKMIRSWRRSSFEREAWQSVLLRESGIYYFWIQRQLENGEIGPVLGQSARFEGLTGTVKFESGISVSVAIEFPQSAAVVGKRTQDEFSELARRSFAKYPSYEMVAVQAFWGDAAFMQQCVPQGTLPLPSPMKIYVEISADGHMGNAHFFPNSKTAECVRMFTAGRVFPKPPEPYVVEIELQFKQ